ncbi:MAG: polysaccharide deacetylase family protein [Solirubrobacterales bacterium]|nr:polysaccharide deacetylase family protein [Solirubrobacterales bacterium]
MGLATAALLGACGSAGPAGSATPNGARLVGGGRGALSVASGHSSSARPPARVRARGPRGTESVPILMYHVIAPPPAGAPFPGLYVPPPEFEAQMRALVRAHFRAVTLDQLEANWRQGVPLPPGRPIVLSFDNGYHSQYATAMPVLRRLGWAGVENIQLTGLPPSQGGLSDPEVRALLAAHWELDTQGISHADLPTLTPTQLHYQVTVARQLLQRRYHVPVNWFCYPSGHYNAAVVAEVRAAGYLGSTTVVPGWAAPSQDPYRLPRLRVLGGTTPSALIAQIAAASTAAPPPASYGAG